jgi:CPA2 family monovalent cation:H+ antiporter-2
LVNFALVAAIFLASGYGATRFAPTLSTWIADERLRNAAIWGAALIVSLPFLVAAYRKLAALSMMLAELGVQRELAGQYTGRARRVVAEVISIAAVVAILFLITALSASVLPPTELLVLVLGVGVGLLTLLWRWFVRLHARLQIALLETLEDEGKHD